MADERTRALDARIEVEEAIAPLIDLVRENNALLRGIVTDLQALRTGIETISSRIDQNSD